MFFLSFSSTSSHDFIVLPDLFCATTFSLNTSATQPLLRSTCPNYLILLVRSTTSKYWILSFVRRESELTSSFALILQIQRNYTGDGLVYPPSWPKSLLHAASHSSHMMSTHHLWSEGAVGEKGKQLAELAPCTFAVCDRSQLTATFCREHVPKVAELWDNFKLFVSKLNL